MANELSQRQTGAIALPVDFAKKLAAGIAQSHREMRQTGGGKPYLRMLKKGNWVYGADDVDVQDGSRWAVNVVEMKHGWSCWVDMGPGQKNKLEGEEMVSILEPKPHQPPPIRSTPFQEQYSFELKCLDGEDEGTEVLYKTASYGGTKAFRKLTDEIMKRAAAENPYLFPAIQLYSESYDHTKHGELFNPIFEVTDWVDMNGDPETPTAGKIAPPAREPEPEPEPVKAAKPRRAPVKAAAPKADPAPVSTQQARAGQRRRPGR